MNKNILNIDAILNVNNINSSYLDSIADIPLNNNEF